MKKIAVCLCLALLCSVVAATAADNRLRVVAGTSLIADIVADLMPNRCEILTLVQGSSCPGHESATTHDYVFAAKATLLLIHPFQRHLPPVCAMLEAVNNPSLAIVEVSPRSSWLIPDVQKRATREIAAALERAAPGQAADIRQRTQARLHKIDVVAAQWRTALTRIKGKRVIAANMQAEFAQWAGFEVVRTYGRAEDVNAQGLAKILRAVNGTDIRAVIDNYQSGSDTGLPLALELGVPHVVLSNFPGSSDDAPDYFSLLRRNVALLQTL